jgi:hypothetical protein
MSENCVMADNMWAIEEKKDKNKYSLLSYGYSFFIFTFFNLCDVWWFCVLPLLFYFDVMRRKRSRNGPILRPAAAHQTSLWKITSPNATFSSDNVSRLLWVCYVWCFFLFKHLLLIISSTVTIASYCLCMPIRTFVYNNSGD